MTLFPGNKGSEFGESRTASGIVRYVLVFSFIDRALEHFRDIPSDKEGSKSDRFSRGSKGSEESVPLRRSSSETSDIEKESATSGSKKSVEGSCESGKKRGEKSEEELGYSEEKDIDNAEPAEDRR